MIEGTLIEIRVNLHMQSLSKLFNKTVMFKLCDVSSVFAQFACISAANLIFDVVSKRFL